ncbi:MAG TPA: RES family NAD+ phosphorylase [Gemmatimonadales bacterium]|nr:RES family NAD+ phosphorylase [Gemmatimonadales bacterium]
MVTAWRLVKSRHAGTAFDGEGARLHGGRWNSPGTRVAYASDSIALAVLEVLAHLQVTNVLQSYSVAVIRFPEERIETLDVASLSPSWRRFPSPPENQAIGDRWVTEARSLALRVPSAIIPSAANYLINPAHPAFGKVVIERPERFNLDPRLFEKAGRR